MSATEPDNKTGTNKSRPRKGGLRRPLWTWPHRILLDLASLTLSIPLLWLAGIAFFMTRSNVNLDFVKPHYEHWFAEAFNGKSSKIESYSARWLPDKRQIEVRAHGVHILDANGDEQTIEDVRGDFRIRTDKGIRPEIVGLSIKGGALTLIRDKKGRLQLGMGTPESWQKVGALWQSSGRGQGVGDLRGVIERIDVENARLFYIDKAGHYKVSLKDIDGSLVVGNQKTSVEIVGAVDMGGGLEAPLDLLAHASPDLQAFDADLIINNLVPIKVAGTSGTLAWLADFDMPIDFNLKVTTNAQRHLKDLNLDITAGEGKIKAGQDFVPFSYGKLAAKYNVEKGQIDIPEFEVDSERLVMAASGTVQNDAPVNADFPNTKNRFDVKIAKARLNPKHMFETPLRLGKSRISGQADLRLRDINLDRLRLDLGGFGTDIKAHIRRGSDGKPVLIKVDGGITGQMSTAQLVQVWPVRVVKGPRKWVQKRIKTGAVSDIRLHINLDKKDLKSGRPVNEHLRVGFNLARASVKFMKTMPPMQQVKGFGVLQGNRFDMTLESAELAGVKLKAGQVNMPRLMPDDGDFTIRLEGEGSVSDMLKISDNKPFFVASHAHLKPESVAGHGSIILNVKRPLKKVRRRDQVTYSIDGRFEDVALDSKRGGMALHNGKIDLHADDHLVTLSGPLQIGYWKSTLDWQKKLGPDAEPAEYTLTGVVDREVLDKYGIGLRRYFGGKIALYVKGRGNDPAVKQADIYADFEQTDLNFGENWSKPEGEDGTLTAKLVFLPDGGFKFDDLEIKAGGLNLEGQLVLGQKFQLRLLDMLKAEIDGLIDSSLKAGPLADGRLGVDMDGRFLNIEYPVTQAFHFSGQQTAVPIKINGHFQTLKLADKYSLESARLEFDRTAKMVQSAHITGKTATGDFVASIVSKTAITPRQVKVRIPDASKAVFALLGLGNIKGGKLAIDGTLPPSGQKGGLQGTFKLENFTLVRAPAFAQILSLASLTGLADTMSGSGLEFAEMEMQFSWEDSVLKIRDGRAAGPALGLTGAGDINIKDKYVDFSGVLVPSYTANSILGGIPLFGKLIVGKKGEGMFALNYSVKGPFDKTRIGVNPLSALTPGFLRRIFDVKREKIKDPNVAELIKKQKDNIPKDKKN